MTDDRIRGVDSGIPGADGHHVPPAGGTVPEGEVADAPLTVPSRTRLGSLVVGTIVAVGRDQMLVDIGGKSDGIVSHAETLVPEGADLSAHFAVGQSLSVMVVGYDAEADTPLLSQRRAAERAAWDHLERCWREAAPVEGRVREAVPGGLVLESGPVSTFMPASLLERGAATDLSSYVGSVLSCRVIALDRRRGKVTLSHRAWLDDEAQRMRAQRWAMLEEGQVYEGVVKRLTDFGAFVDLGGIDGLLHISAMAWGRVARPSDVLAVGDPIAVKVLKLDREHQKVSLGRKQLLPDPWTTVVDRYPLGAMIEGRVVRLAAFGAFVELEPGVDGLVHISHLADHHVRDPREVLREGESVRVKVLHVLAAERRISLSLREADPLPGPAEAPVRADVGLPAASEGGGLGATLGDRIEDLGGLLQRAGLPPYSPPAGENC